MTVQETMNAWGREYLVARGFNVPEGAAITYSEDHWDIAGCATCGHGERSTYEVNVEARESGAFATWRGNFVDLIQEISTWEATHRHRGK